MIGGHPKILIIRLSAIGDVVRVLPAAAALRHAYPSAQIDWVVESAAADILDDNPLLDRVIRFDRSLRVIRSAKLFLRLCRRFQDQHYDIAVDFHGILKSGLLLAATRAARRITFAPPRAREQAHRFGNERITLSAPIMNRVDENLELLLNSKLVKRATGTQVYIDKQINPEVFRAITDQRRDRPWLVLVHAPVDRVEKKWPDESFAVLLDILEKDGRFDVLLTHGPGQREMLTSILSLCKHEPIVPPPCKTLREFAGLASMASMYIGVDTGPMHIAAAMGTPVVAIFGGTSPKMHSPVGARSRVLGGVSLKRSSDRVPLSESELVLRSVAPADVMSAVVELLEELG